MDVVDLSPAETDALPIDAFAGRPGWASRIEGLGGSDAPSDPGYIFCTISVRPATGPVTISIHFHNLRASKGMLLVEVVGVSSFPGAEMSRIKTFSVPISRLVGTGVLDVPFEARRNTLYAVYGAINDDSDAVADAITAQLDRPEPQAGNAPAWNWKSTAAQARSTPENFVTTSLTSLARPTFDAPVSQIATPGQLRSSDCREWTERLKIDPEAGPLSTYGSAFVAQVLREYGALHEHIGGLGFGNRVQNLPSFFAAQNIQVLTVEHLEDDVDYDQGEMLEKLYNPALCEEREFFEHVHLTATRLPQFPPSLIDWFDFTWSIGLNRDLGAQEFERFLPDTLSCLKPGGIAVHVFDYDPQGQSSGPALDRPAIERMMLRCLARHDHTAMLKFRPHEAMDPLPSPYPFGVIMRRAIR